MSDVCDKLKEQTCKHLFYEYTKCHKKYEECVKKECDAWSRYRPRSSWMPPLECSKESEHLYQTLKYLDCDKYLQVNK